MSGVVSVAWPSLRTAIMGSLPIGDTGLREPKLRPATRRQVFSRACLRSWAGKLRQFRTERKDRKERMSKRRRQSAHAAGRRVVRQKPGVAALADEGDLGVKACPSRPRSSVGWQQRISNAQVAVSNAAGAATPSIYPFRN